MSRMQGVSPGEMNERQREIAAEIASGPRGRVGTLMQLWLHSPDLAEHVQRAGGYFRVQKNMPPHCMEMVVLITARHWRCEYEWLQHKPLARSKGLEASIIEAIRAGRRPQFDDPVLEAAYDYTTAMLETHGVTDEVFARAEKTFGTGGIVDLSILIGHYIHGAILLNAVQVPRPEGVASPFAATAAS